MWPAAGVLESLLDGPGVPPAVHLRAASQLLDQAGVVPGSRVEVASDLTLPTDPDDLGALLDELDADVLSGALAAMHFRSATDADLAELVTEELATMPTEVLERALETARARQAP